MIKHKCISFFIFFVLIPIFSNTAPVNTVVATTNVGVTPAGLAITPDNRYAYVANNNNYGLVGENNVTVIDLQTNLPVTTINDVSFNQPYTITINPAGTRAYVTNSNACSITIIDITTNTVTGTISGGTLDGPSGMAITPDGSTGYVNNYGAPCGVGSGNGTTVSVVNLNTNTITTTLTVDQAPAALAITPDGAFIYVINYVDGNPGTGTIRIIRTSDNTVLGTVIPGFSGPFGIAITPDGNYAYVTNFGSNDFCPYGTTVTAVDLNSNTVIATIQLNSIQPAGVAITPDGRYAYTTNYNTIYGNPNSFLDLIAGQGTVNIIDIENNTLLAPTIEVNQSPANIAISPNGNFAYVTNFTSNVVNVIALPTFDLEAEGCKTCNQFLTQRDLINRLTWAVSGTTLPVSYSIYRDEALTDLVAIVPATEPFTFLDHNRDQNLTYTYYIVGTNAVGTTSEPVVVTVTQNC